MMVNKNLLYNQQENAEHIRSSCSIGQAHRQPGISYEELTNLILPLTTQ